MKLIHTTLVLSFLFTVTATTQAQKLNRNERRIIERVSANNEEAINFLEKVVNINSGSLNLEGVKE